MLSKTVYKTSTLLRAFTQSRKFTTYANKHHEHATLANNEATLAAFWKEQAKMVDWYKEPTQIYDNSNPPFFKWFQDGVLNTSYNCLDRHIHRGAGSDIAIAYESPVTGVSATYTYAEMLDKVSRFANVLQRHGVGKGDKVVIYMPMIPEALVAIHACARIGAVHSVVFGGFAGLELAKRIKDAQPKLIVSASCGVEPTFTVDYKAILEEAVGIANTPDLKRIIVQRDIKRAELKKGLDFEFYDELAKAKSVDPVPVKATDPLYILYTSGTTGTPKGIVRQHGGHAVSLSYSAKYMIDIGHRDTYFCATDIGLITGHTFTVYGPLFAGGTSLLYEGKPVGTPDSSIFWKLCEKHKVKGLFTSPTALRAIRKEDPEGNHIRKANLSNLRTVSTSGERLDTITYDWTKSMMPKTCILTEAYGQTESGWFISTNYANLHTFPEKAGVSGKPSPGMNIVVIGEDGKPVPPMTMGAVCLKHPLPPGFAATLNNNDEGFVEKYMTRYPGHYFTEDLGYLDEEGLLNIVCRMDDMLKVGGHRMSTLRMEEILSQHKDVIEVAVVGARDNIKGELPVGFIALKAGVVRSHSEVEAECVQKIKDVLGTVAQFNSCIVVDKLPKNKSAKILRLILKRIINGDPVEMPPTIEDPTVIDAIKERVREHGLGKKADLKYVDAPKSATL